MAGTLHLILALHNHQPVGNFDGVFEQSYQESYRPFLNLISEYPEIPFALHTSGSLLEWLEQRHPEYIDQVRSLVERGQTEIIGGAFYEPILSNITRRDRIGQIQSFTHHLEKLFGTSVRGMWMPERVWEQSFAGDLTAAGIQYTILDDHHFRSAGMSDDELFGYYATEDEGRLLAVLPGSERLRYLIPFRNPEETVAYLNEIAQQHDDPVVVFGDDGEKFGTWPETHKHVYEDGWLRRFLQALRENSDWLKVTTPSETLDHVKAKGLFYIPDASYREMTEWVLDSSTQQDLQRLSHIDGDANWKRLLQFARGGFWRNFRVKYPESNEMYARMLEISTRLAVAEQDADSDAGELAEIRQHLYRGQCNCAYWHGAFGGLYLPHLRNAVYSSLIEADNQLEKLSRSSDKWVDVSTGDYNLDTHHEIRLSSHRMVAYFRPSVGGHLYEWDVRTCRVNLLATLDRRPEPYHRKVLEHAEFLRHNDGRNESEVASIHDIVRFKQPNLDLKLAYDSWSRKSLVDHFLQPDLSGDAFRRGEGVLSAFSTAPYDATVERSNDEVILQMTCRGKVSVHEITIRKVVTMSKKRPGELLVHYQLDELPQGVPLHFAAEFNFATMPGGASDRYFYDANGEQLGSLDACIDLPESSRLGLVDEWQGLDVSVEWTQDGGVWASPIETISQSESGFELVHQSVAVSPHWNFVAPEDGSWTADLRLTVNTSLAQARQLAELGEHRLVEKPEHEHLAETVD
jgi:alpha-amylase